MQKPYWYPRHDRVSLLVYAASATDADTVIVNGKVLMKNGELLEMDVEKIYAEANFKASWAGIRMDHRLFLYEA